MYRTFTELGFLGDDSVFEHRTIPATSHNPMWYPQHIFQFFVLSYSGINVLTFQMTLCLLNYPSFLKGKLEIMQHIRAHFCMYLCVVMFVYMHTSWNLFHCPMWVLSVLLLFTLFLSSLFFFWLIRGKVSSGNNVVERPQKAQKHIVGQVHEGLICVLFTMFSWV